MLAAAQVGVQLVPIPSGPRGPNPDDLDRAFASVRAIVDAERLRRDRRHGMFDFVGGLLG